MADQDMPHAVRAEIVDLLQSLKRSWPHYTTIVHRPKGKSGHSDARIERYMQAIQWLTDRGLICFEAMIVDLRGLSIRDAALTPRGHDYSRTHIPAEINGRPES